MKICLQEKFSLTILATTIPPALSAPSAADLFQINSSGPKRITNTAETVMGPNLEHNVSNAVNSSMQSSIEQLFTWSILGMTHA